MFYIVKGTRGERVQGMHMVTLQEVVQCRSAIEHHHAILCACYTTYHALTSSSCTSLHDFH